MDATIEQARWFSWRRQRLDRTCRGVEDCLQSVIGVYSANPSGPLSLLARVPRLLKGAAVEGVIDTKRAVRIPAMRRSIYLVPIETAHLAFAASRSGKEFEWLLRRSEISEQTYERLREAILGVTESPKDAEQIRAEVPKTPANLTVVLQAMCAEGVLLRVKSSSIRSNDFTYAATEAWLGAPLKSVDPSEALVWLAGDYLTAFGPATVEDFAWWTGAPKPHAAAAIQAHDPVDLGGGLMLHQKDERAFGGTREHLGRVSLLPKWDCYTMGYAPGGRARFVADEMLPVAYDAGGNAQPMVLVEGEVHGVWSFRAGTKRMTIRLEMFDEPGPRLRAAIDSEAELVAGFLEAPSMTIERARAPKKPAPPRARPAKKRPGSPAPRGRTGRRPSGGP